jgi:hypothetical protein
MRRKRNSFEETALRYLHLISPTYPSIHSIESLIDTTLQRHELNKKYLDTYNKGASMPNTQVLIEREGQGTVVSGQCYIDVFQASP